MPFTISSQPKPQNNQRRTEQNPELEDGETYFGTFIGFSKPFFVDDKYHPGEQVQKTVLLYELDNVGKYKEFMKISAYDGANGKYAEAPLYRRLVQLCGVRNQAQAEQIDLEAIHNLRVRVTAGRNARGYTVLTSVKVVAPSVTAHAGQPPRQNAGLKPISTAIPGAVEHPLSLDDVKYAFLATGRSAVAFDAFLTVYGGPGANVRPEACQALLKAVAGLPKIETPASMTAQAEAVGLDLEEPGNYSDDLA